MTKSNYNKMLQKRELTSKKRKNNILFKPEHIFCSKSSVSLSSNKQKQLLFCWTFPLYSPWCHICERKKHDSSLFIFPAATLTRCCHPRAFDITDQNGFSFFLTLFLTLFFSVLSIIPYHSLSLVVLFLKLLPFPGLTSCLFFFFSFPLLCFIFNFSSLYPFFPMLSLSVSSVFHFFLFFLSLASFYLYNFACSIHPFYAVLCGMWNVECGDGGDRESQVCFQRIS